MTAEAAVERVSNMEFARRVGCDHTTASRLRSGQRMPSAGMLSKIVTAYSLDGQEALRQYGKGPRAFSRWLRDTVFGD